MRNFTFAILCFSLLVGAFQAKSQNKIKSLEENRAFKQKLMNEAQFGYDNTILKSNSSKQKNSLSPKSFGDVPDLNWTEQIGGSGDDNANAVISDEKGNIFITGSFSGKMSISGNEYVATGNREAYVAKFDSTGSLIWLSQIPASEDNETSCNDICMDVGGNLYVTGYYTGTITVGANSLPDVNNYSLFYAKLDSDGNLINGVSHSKDENESGLFIDTDDDENIYITGTKSVSNSSIHASWILKYNQSTDLVWEQSHDEGFNDIIVCGSDIYYTGVAQSADDGFVDENVSFTPPLGKYDIFVAKSNIDGEFIWLKIAKHKEFSRGDSREGYFNTDGNGNFLLSGNYRENIIWGQDSLEANGGFVTKFDEAGNFSWIKQVGSYNSSPKLCVDSKANSYVSDFTVIEKYDSAGNKQFTDTLNYSADALCFTSQDKIVISGDKDGLIFLSQMDSTASENWVDEFEGNSASGYLIGMVTDNLGNVYTYNYTSNTIDFCGEKVNKGIFICKQNCKKEVVWLKQFPDIYAGCDFGSYMAIDTTNENVFIAGNLLDTLKIPEGPTLTPIDGRSIFILKYGFDGTYKWSKIEDVNNYSEGSIVADNSGNLLLSGTFFFPINISGTEFVSLGSRDAFIAKYDADGDFKWAKRAGGNDTEYSGLVSVDTNDNIYFTGEFLSENVTVDNTEITLAEGDGNILLAKFDPDGNVLWLTSHAGSSLEWHDGSSFPTGIKTYADGYTYIKGWHGDSAYFDNIVLTSPYYINKFIAKFDPEGKAIWAKSITEHSLAFDYNQFDIDNIGNVYFGLQVKDTIDFASDFQYVPAGNRDLVVAKYTAEGNLDWVKTMEGDDTGYNWISSVAVNNKSNVFVGGYFNNYLAIDDEVLTSTNKHGFVAMFEEVSDFNVSATANPAEGGTISGAGDYNSGDTANLMVATNPGYNFVNWTSGGTEVSTDTIYSFTVTSNISLVANFEEKTSITEFGNDTQFLVYPNPAKDFVNIKLNNLNVNDVDNIQLSLFNYLGKSCEINTKKINSDNFQLDIFDKPEGIYFLRISHNNKLLEMIKLIIIK